MKKRKKSYGANAEKTPIVFNGKKILLSSKLEAKVAKELIIKERAGLIRDLILQPQFELIEGFNIRTTATKNGKSRQSSVSYTADFAYIDTLTDEQVVLETKGFATDLYKLRRRIFLKMLEEFGIDIFIEVYANKTIEYRKA